MTVELEEKDRFRLTKEKVLEKLTPKTKILVLPYTKARREHVFPRQIFQRPRNARFRAQLFQLTIGFR